MFVSLLQETQTLTILFVFVCCVVWCGVGGCGRESIGEGGRVEVEVGFWVLGLKFNAHTFSTNCRMAWLPKYYIESKEQERSRSILKFFVQTNRYP